MIIFNTIPKFTLTNKKLDNLQDTIEQVSIT